MSEGESPLQSPALASGEPPRDVATFLFTGIVGSASLLRQLGDNHAGLMAESPRTRTMTTGVPDLPARAECPEAEQARRRERKR